MAVLTADQILTASDLPTERVQTPEWGGEVIVTTLSGKDRDAFEIERLPKRGGASEEVNMRNFRAALVARCCVDETGKRIFTNDQVEALGDKSSLVIDRVFEVASRLNGLSTKDAKAILKNLDRDQDAGSSSN